MRATVFGIEAELAISLVVSISRELGEYIFSQKYHGGGCRGSSSNPILNFRADSLDNIWQNSVVQIAIPGQWPSGYGRGLQRCSMRAFNG